MNSYKDEVNETFGGRIRIRACGVLVEKNQILLVKHLGVGKKGTLWAPPGGGVVLGEISKETVKREFLEETGLEVEVKEFLFYSEFVNLPLHSVELFFKVNRIGGTLVKGTDPEISTTDLIDSVAFKSLEEIKKEGLEYYHSMFANLDDLKNL